MLKLTDIILTLSDFNNAIKNKSLTSTEMKII